MKVPASVSPMHLPTVLVLMADPTLEALYQESLPRLLGYPCDWARGIASDAGLDRYEILVVDLALFQDDPVQSVRALRNRLPNSELIVLSDTHEVRTAIGIFRLGVADYFLKPTSPETLAWAIDKVHRQQEMTRSSAPLASELNIFRATHHIHIAETEPKMRLLAMQMLADALDAESAIFICGKTIETFALDLQAAKESIAHFDKLHPNHRKNSFENATTSQPEQWFQGKYVWIPLREKAFGGILLVNSRSANHSVVLSRAEYIVRNLELALENYRRYVQVKQLTYTDDFTGLFNSRYLEVALHSAFDSYTSNHKPFSVLFVDIDHFKKVNDSHGHRVGSQLLFEISQVLRSTLREKDPLFRYGGDEFIVLLPDSGPEKAKAVGERLRKAIADKVFQIHGIDIRITASIGVASVPTHTSKQEEILAMADSAMYSVKSAGRNSVFVATPNPKKEHET